MRKQALKKQARKSVWQLLKSQCIVLVLAICLTAVLGNGMAAIALLGGGIAWLVPSALHALIFMRVIWPSKAKQTMKRFILAEVVRLGLGGVIAVFMLKMWPVYAPWVVAGLGLTALAVVFVPLLNKIGL